MARTPAKPPKVKRPRRPNGLPPGRPTIYTKELAIAICENLMNGTSLRQVCELDGMPSRPTVMRWLATDLDGFESRYIRAKTIQLMGAADDMLDLADTCRMGERKTVKPSGETEVTTGDMVERVRLQLDTRKWLLSKLIPKKYGDKIELAGEIGIRGARELSNEDLAKIASGALKVANTED